MRKHLFPVYAGKRCFFVCMKGEERLPHGFIFYVHASAIIAGIAAGLSNRLAAIAALMLIVVLVATVFHKWQAEWYSLRKAALTILLALLAALYGYWTEANNRSALPTSLAEQAVTVTGVIVSPVEVDGDRVRLQMLAEQIDASDVSETNTYDDLSERLQVTIYLQEQEEKQVALTWRRGMSLRLAGTLQLPNVARNFGDFDYRTYLHHQRIHWQLTAIGLQDAEMRMTHSWHVSKLFSLVDSIRQMLTARISMHYAEPFDGFMQGLLIGDRSELPQDIYDRFSDIGMTHVLAISGLHVGVFAAGCFALLKLLRLSKEKICSIILLLIPLYVLTTGAAPSAMRAGIMAMLGFIALRNNRWKDTFRYLLLAAVGMLLWNPYYLYNVGFQLSFIVTFGLILFVPKMSALLKLPAVLSGALSVTVVAQAFSFPLIIYYFHSVHLLSPIANLLLVPMVSVVILPLGMVSLCLSFVAPPLASVPAAIVMWLSDLLFQAVEWTSTQERFQLSWAKVPVWWIVTYYMLLIGFVIVWPHLRDEGRLRWRRIVSVMTASLMLALLVYGYAGNHLARTGIVSALDVGQGDAILIRTPHGKHILVDGGGIIRFAKSGEEWRERKDPFEVGKDLLVPLIKRRGIHKLDAIIATHQDTDHIGGLHAVLEHIPTERILFNGTAKQSAAWERLVQSAESRGIPMYPVSSGMNWEVDAHTSLTFLHPIGGFQGGSFVPVAADQNDLSVVFVLVMYEATFVMTGDIGTREEQEILRHLRESNISGDMQRQAVDVLKVAHHGSKYSTSDEWLAYWQPTTGVISVGRNHYGHPTAEVLERLAARQIQTYRTDLHGEVQYMATPHGLKLRTKLSP